MVYRHKVANHSYSFHVSLIVAVAFHATAFLCNCSTLQLLSLAASFFVAAFSYHCSFFQVGILLAWHSLGASVGALIGGSLFDVHGNYQLSLMLCAGKVKRDGYFNLFNS